MKKTLVLGCGNVFAGDDCVGVRVVEQLSQKTLPPGVEIIKAGTAGSFLLGLIAGAEKVIIVDAVRGDAETGTVMRLTEADLLLKESAYRSTHHLGVAEIIGLGRVVDPENFPQEVVIIGIQIQQQKGWRHGLTPSVAAAVEKAVAAVEREIWGKEAF